MPRQKKNSAALLKQGKVSIDHASIVPNETASKPLRDARGRLLPGQSGNPGGVSKYRAEFKEMCEHVLMNDGWDRWHERLNDSKTPAIVLHAMVEWLHAVVHGKPGVRKDDESGPTVEQLKEMLPDIVFTQKERLESAGYKVTAHTKWEDGLNKPVEDK